MFFYNMSPKYPLRIFKFKQIFIILGIKSIIFYIYWQESKHLGKATNFTMTRL